GDGWQRNPAWCPSCLSKSKSPQQSARTRRKQLLRRYRFGDDALRQRVPDERIDDVAVGRDTVGERLAGDLHHPPVHLVDLRRLLEPARFQPLDVVTLGAGEGVA